MRRFFSRDRHRRVPASHPGTDALESRQLLSAAELILSSLLPANGGDGSAGFVVTGDIDQGHLRGSSSESCPVGDVNDDGIDDLLLMAPYDVFIGATAGQAYLVFGRPGGFPAELDLAALDGTSGYRIRNGQADAPFGATCSGVGDVNHDGVPDLAFNAGSSDIQGVGRSLVLYGGAGRLAALDAADGLPDGDIALGTLDGIHGFEIRGTVEHHATLRTGVGDINHDGIDDLAFTSAGPNYVLFGRDAGVGDAFPALLELAGLDGSNGFTILRPADAATGMAVLIAGAGDVNGDGIGDLALGNPSLDPGGMTDSGQGFVIFGRASYPASLDLTTLNGSNGFSVRSATGGDWLGMTADGAGDVNGDGVDDVVFAAFDLYGTGGASSLYDDDKGGACVVFGKRTATAGAFPAMISASAINGSNGFLIRGINTGDWVSAAYGAGDVNGDGYDDVVLSSSAARRDGVLLGEGYVVYGGPSFPASVNLGTLLEANGGDGSVGRVFKAFQPADRTGLFCGKIGDINHDGFDDLRFTSQSVDVNGLTDNGQAYIVFGAPSPSRPTKFYVVNDGSPDRTYAYTATSVATGNTALNSADTAPRGIASTAAGDRYWVVDANRKVYVYTTGGALLGSWTAGTLASNAQVEGIATDGNDVWIVDAKSDKVYRYAGAATRLSGSQNAASTFKLSSGNTNPKDIVTDGSSLWVINDSASAWTDDKVFKYTTSGTALGSWGALGGECSPTGITLDPTRPGSLWILDRGAKRVYQYDNAAGLTSGIWFPSTSFALAAGNTNPQGIADPPPAGATSPPATNRPTASGVGSTAAETATGPARPARNPTLAMAGVALRSTGVLDTLMALSILTDDLLVDRALDELMPLLRPGEKRRRP